MSRRTFTDANGTEWTVYDVVEVPSFAPLQPPRSSQFQPTTTWLAFVSAKERRRLSPAPPDWTEASVAELEALLARATRVAIFLKREE